MVRPLESVSRVRVSLTVSTKHRTADGPSARCARGVSIIGAIVLAAAYRPALVCVLWWPSVSAVHAIVSTQHATIVA